MAAVLTLVSGCASDDADGTETTTVTTTSTATECDEQPTTWPDDLVTAHELCMLDGQPWTDNVPNPIFVWLGLPDEGACHDAVFTLWETEKDARAAAVGIGLPQAGATQADGGTSALVLAAVTLPGDASLYDAVAATCAHNPEFTFLDSPVAGWSGVQSVDTANVGHPAVQTWWIAVGGRLALIQFEPPTTEANVKTVLCAQLAKLNVADSGSSDTADDCDKAGDA